MGATQAEAFEASRAIDVSEEKAPRAAAALSGALAGEVGAASAPQRGHLSSLMSDVSTLKADVGTLKADVTALKSEVSALKADVGVLDSDVATLGTDMVAVKAGFVKLESDVTASKTGLERTNGELAVLRWMGGFALAFLVALTLRIFLH